MHTDKAHENRVLRTLRVLFFYFCSICILIFTSSLTNKLPVKTADLLSIIIASIFTFFLVVIFSKWAKLSLRDVGIIPGKLSAKRFISGFIIGLLMAIVQLLFVFIFEHLKLTLSSQVSIETIGYSFLLYFFIACREELVFRSYLLTSLTRFSKISIALLIMILLFIIEHVIAGVVLKFAIIGSALGGLLFGIAALKTKGLALPIGLHCAWNFGQWALGFKNQSGIFDAIVDKGYEYQSENIGLFAFIFVMLIAICLIVYFYPKKSRYLIK